MDHSRIEDETRRQVAEFLPRAIKYALDSYEAFSIANIELTKFSQHHTACKVAIAHIQLLIKLAQWADLPDASLTDADKDKALQQMIASAGAELQGAGLQAFEISEEGEVQEEGEEGQEI